MSYFPMFVNIEDKNCLIVGGGKVALRKALAFLDFGAKVQVIAPTIIEEIKKEHSVVCTERKFQKEDLENRDIVIAATDLKETNREISMFCKQKHIMVNCVTSKEESTFLVPAYVKNGKNVAAFSSGGRSPMIPQFLKEKIKPYVNDDLELLTRRLAEAREIGKNSSLSMQEKKKIYHIIMEKWEMEGSILSAEEIQKLFS